MINSNKKCEYCQNGLCTFYRDIEEQYDDEQDGLPTDQQVTSCYELTIGVMVVKNVSSVLNELNNI